MKTTTLVLVFYSLACLMNAQEASVDGLWKVVDHVFDGSVKRLDNHYVSVKGGAVGFFVGDSLIDKGLLRNDTIFIEGGFGRYDIDWFRIVNAHTLMSSLPNLKASDGLTLKKMDVSGIWERLDHLFTGVVLRDTCTLVQVRDSVFFISADTCFAMGCLKADSLVITNGFEGPGIHQFTVYSNDYFNIIAPLAEIIDKVEFVRMGSDRTDTLYCAEAFDLPDVMETSGLNLAWDGSHYWLNEAMTGMVFKINPEGVCIDSFTTVKSNCLEYAEGSLWVNRGDYFLRLDNTTHEPVDSIRNEASLAFIGMYGCQDFCYMDGAFYSAWYYCWCGVHRLLKHDLSTGTTTDLGDIPLSFNLIAWNDTLWGGHQTLTPVYASFSVLPVARKLYAGNFEISGLVHQGDNLVLVDLTNKQLKVMHDVPVSLKPVRATIPDALELYPNPATDVLSVRLAGSDGPYRVSIHSLDGRCHLTQTRHQPAATIDIHSLPPGLYILSASDGSKTAHRRFIKH